MSFFLPCLTRWAYVKHGEKVTFLLILLLKTISISANFQVHYRKREREREKKWAGTEERKNRVKNEHSRFVALSGHVSTRLFSLYLFSENEKVKKKRNGGQSLQSIIKRQERKSIRKYERQQYNCSTVETHE
jgi:hypothetical protein